MAEDPVAQAILKRAVADLRKLTWEELVKRIGQPTTEEIPTENGDYQIEVQCFWDATPRKDVRVLVAIDGGSISPLSPQCDDFITAPDNSFVGE